MADLARRAAGTPQATPAQPIVEDAAREWPAPRVAGPPRKRSGIAKWLVAIVLVLAVLVAIAAPPSKQSSGSSAPATTSGVPWADYATDVQPRIESLRAANNCSGLQAEFDNADANNVATLNRTGHNNAELMGYIDGKLREAGCY